MKKFFHDYGTPLMLSLIFIGQLILISAAATTLKTLGYYEITHCEDGIDTTATD